MPSTSILRVLVIMAASAGLSCGGDSGGPDSNPGRPDGGGPAGDAGVDDKGSDGWPCQAEDDCNDGLRCATSPLLLNGVPIGVCAPACGAGMSCEDESHVCINYGQDAEEAHCVNEVEEEYGVCGVADTSVCADEMTCLYFPNLPIGVCVNICALSDAEPMDSDAGAGMPGATVACGSEQTCVDGVLDDPTGTQGVCGEEVARGELCGVELGLYCGADDVCAPEDPTDEAALFRCYQDCSEPNTECEQGRCVIVQRLFAYCL